MRQIEILDTTLRDGEQTSGVSFSRTEKMAIVRLLIEDLNVPRIEIASARVSEGELLTAKHICQWAKSTGNINKIEILGFIDNGVSIDWIKRVGAKTINLLAKGTVVFSSAKNPPSILPKSKQTYLKPTDKALE